MRWHKLRCRNHRWKKGLTNGMHYCGNPQSKNNNSCGLLRVYLYRAMERGKQMGLSTPSSPKIPLCLQCPGQTLPSLHYSWGQDEAPCTCHTSALAPKVVGRSCECKGRLPNLVADRPLTLHTAYLTWTNKEVFFFAPKTTKFFPMF